jgi:hypothetical protein
VPDSLSIEEDWSIRFLRERGAELTRWGPMKRCTILGMLERTKPPGATVLGYSG